MIFKTNPFLAPNGFWAGLLVVFMLAISACGTDTGTADDDPLEKFLGVWQVSDQPARLNYEVTLERSFSNTVEILLINFADLGGTAVGLVVGNSIIIDKQSVTKDYQVEGTGFYVSPTELRFEYELDDGIDIEKRKAQFIK